MTLKDDWEIGDAYTAPDANAVAVAVNALEAGDLLPAQLAALLTDNGDGTWTLNLGA